MTSEDLKKMMGESWDRAFMDACYGPAQTARITGACTNTDPPQPDPRTTARTATEVKLAYDAVLRGGAQVRAQMESVQEQMRYARESHHSLYKAGLLDLPSQTEDEIKQLRQQMIDRAAIRFLQGPVLRLKKPDPAPLTFTALQETVLPDLYGKKQHAQLLAAAKQREADEAARLREETNNKIGGLLRGFLGARREEE